MAGQVWSVDVLGGYMYSDELSDKLRIELLPAVKFRRRDGKGLELWRILQLERV